MNSSPTHTTERLRFNRRWPTPQTTPCRHHQIDDRWYSIIFLQQAFRFLRRDFCIPVCLFPSCSHGVSPECICIELWASVGFGPLNGIFLCLPRTVVIMGTGFIGDPCLVPLVPKNGAPRPHSGGQQKLPYLFPYPSQWPPLASHDPSRSSLTMVTADCHRGSSCCAVLPWQCRTCASDVPTIYKVLCAVSNLIRVYKSPTPKGKTLCCPCFCVLPSTRPSVEYRLLHIWNVHRFQNTTQGIC